METKEAYVSNLESIEVYRKMIELSDGISLSQICNITHLEPHTIQNWVKRGYIPHPIKKKYYLKHLARTLLINTLKNCMYIEDINSLMVYINGDVDDESDDIIGDDDLYELFFNLIKSIDDIKEIDNVINLKVEGKKLNICMKTMIYAYYGSLMSKKSDYYLKLTK